MNVVSHKHSLEQFQDSQFSLGLSRLTRQETLAPHKKSVEQLMQTKEKFKLQIDIIDKSLRNAGKFGILTPDDIDQLNQSKKLAQIKIEEISARILKI